MTAKFGSKRLSAAILKSSIGFNIAIEYMTYSSTELRISSPISARSIKASMISQSKNATPWPVSWFLIRLEMKKPSDKKTILRLKSRPK